ncbi:DsbA family protein [Bifidobacterium oedipodis]|uniref:DSBA oxidoreductase n=1 Tax=Bifidobacterium oedipodis TaxID=2675322 RepID=A0A7Y0ER20_9BIFI|nr:thioredoxin domain-containing protein [Bifidobacterium sp. DSM 109957]NMM94822.1 DSBA oxidoreductase [Bifidobacterium sp. DSM 109957]
MADQKRQVKRTTRAERREAEAAAARARAEQAAKERKQQTIIGCIVVALIVVLVAIAGFFVWRAIQPSGDDQSSAQSVDEAYTAMQQVELKPAKANDKAGFVISKNGYDDKVKDAPTVAIYMEPLCPGCASINRQLDPTLIKLMQAGQLNIELHFLNFQNNKSSDDYSNRAFNGAIYIAEHDDDPEHLLEYIANIYAEDFQPGELSNYTPTDNTKLEEQAVKAGVSEEVAAQAFSGDNEYVEWLTASNNYTIRRPELFNSSGNFSSPTLTINDQYWKTTDVSLADMTLVDGFLKSIGLDADQVGKEGAMPSIGADGKPISLTE